MLVNSAQEAVESYSKNGKKGNPEDEDDDEDMDEDEDDEDEDEDDDIDDESLEKKPPVKK